MNDDYIVPTYVILAEILEAVGHQEDSRSQVSSAEIIIVAVVAAKYFQNHHERAVCLMVQLGYIPKISVSRFNRRLHALGELLSWICQILGELFSTGDLFIIDAMPIPVCKPVRAKRCRKLQGSAYHGFCHSKHEAYFGWQLHLICDTQGIPVVFELLPARADELVPLQDLLANLPPHSTVLADKGYVSAHHQVLAWVYGQVRLVARHRVNMPANDASDLDLLSGHRSRIETVNSQLEKMGVQRLHARSNPGIALKILASLIALTFSNL